MTDIIERVLMLIAAAALLILLILVVFGGRYRAEEAPVITPTPIIKEVPADGVLTVEHTYTPAVLAGEAALTPAMIQALPDFEECAAVLAQMLWGEIRGGSDEAVAAVCWVPCNRAKERTPAAVTAEIQAEGQFHGYSPENPIELRLYEIAKSQLILWLMEPYMEVPRPLPPEYKWFGGDGEYNTFRDAYIGGNSIRVE